MRPTDQILKVIYTDHLLVRKYLRLFKSFLGQVELNGLDPLMPSLIQILEFFHKFQDNYHSEKEEAITNYLLESQTDSEASILFGFVGMEHDHLRSQLKSLLLMLDEDETVDFLQAAHHYADTMSKHLKNEEADYNNRVIKGGLQLNYHTIVEIINDVDASYNKGKTHELYQALYSKLEMEL